MDELEDRLRRYRPVGPPASLRGRVVAPHATPVRHRWAWVPCAAAAAAAFTFYALAASARRDLAAELIRMDPRRDAIVQALAADLGGDEEAGRLAARYVELNQTFATAGANPDSSPDAEGDRHE
jgi:hypothetical protein